MKVFGMKQLDKAISLVDGCPEDPIEAKISVDFACKAGTSSIEPLVCAIFAGEV